MSTHPDYITPLRAMLFDDLPLGIAVVSVENNRYIFRDANRWIQTITGYSLDELIDQPISILRGPRTKDEAEVSRELSRPNRVEWFQDTLYTASHEPRTVEILVRPLSSDSLGEHAAVLTVRDVSRVVRATNAQTLASQMSDLVRSGRTTPIDAGKIAHLMCDSYGDWCAIHQFNPNGQLVLTALANSEGPVPIEHHSTVSLMSGIGAVARSRITLRHQMSLPANPQLVRQIQRIVDQPIQAVVCVPIAGYTNELYGAMTLAITLDARQYHSQEVDAIEEAGLKYGHYLSERATRDSLTDALGAREGFMIAAGHELRTPLVSIKGYTQMLLRGLRRRALSEQRLESGLKAVDESASRLGLLMEELLSTSTTSAEPLLPLRTRDVDLREFIEQFFEEGDCLFSARHHIDMSGVTSGIRVRIDPDRFSQVLHNVILNAVQYSPDQSKVAIWTETDGDVVRIVVRDEGIGLDKESIESIFDVFTTAGQRLDNRDPGLGIGLFISRQIVNRHKGKIWAESDGPNTGTSIKIELAITAA